MDEHATMLGLQGGRVEALSPCHPVTLSPCHPPAVVCRGVTKEFGQGEARTLALRGVDLEAEAGRITLLVGPSGCGKTTLISIIAGLLDPTAGEVTVLVNAQGQYVINRTPVVFRTIDQLADELRRAGGNAKEPVVVITADAAATHQSVVRVMEAATGVGLWRAL